jgi:hypothetical protein
MAANTSPIYSKIGDIQWGAVLTTANTALDGTGTVSTIFTADATNGGRVEKVRIRHLGTNVTTVLRIFINNGSTNTTATNNALWTEITIASNTLSQVAASTNYELPSGTDPSFPLVLPIGYKLLATIGTTVAAGLAVIAAGGKY